MTDAAETERRRVRRRARRSNGNGATPASRRPKTFPPSVIECTPEIVEQARKLVLLGLSRQELAKFFEVSSPVFKDWEETVPEFAEVIHQGRLPASAEVTVSLFKRACGYSHPSEKIFLVDETVITRDPNTGQIVSEVTTKKPLRVPFTEHYAPDTAAIALWLFNCDREKWRPATQEVSANVAGEVVFKLEVGTPGELSRSDREQHPQEADGGPLIEGEVVAGSGQEAGRQVSTTVAVP